MSDTPNLKLPYLMAAQAQKHVTHNEAIRALDAIVQLSVLNKILASPPASPIDGDRHIVAGSASGVWVGKEEQIAAWQDNAWMFFAPLEGWLAWVADEDALSVFDGASWSEVSGGVASINPAALVGVNATADAANRLTVSSPASLFNHEGAGHQVKVNKNAVADTGSFLFQTGFSGRAEIGLAGDDDFHFKVSADGTSWSDSFTIDALSGEAAFAQPLSLKQFSKSALPSTTASGRLIYVHDATGGACTAYCDGSSWKRVSDNSVIN